MINESNTCGGRRGCTADNKLPRCCTVVYVYSEVVRIGHDSTSVLRVSKLGMDKATKTKTQQDNKANIKTVRAMRILSGLLDISYCQFN